MQAVIRFNINVINYLKFIAISVPELKMNENEESKGQTQQHLQSRLKTNSIKWYLYFKYAF